MNVTFTHKTKLADINIVAIMYLFLLHMIDSDQRPYSNRHPLIKAASTNVIIGNHGPIKGYSQIGVLSKFSDLWPIYWLELEHRSVMSLDVDLRK